MYKLCNLIIISLCALLPAISFAATNDFTANSDITVSNVTFGATTADLLIFNNSASESWTFNNGIFTVTNPGTFKVGSSNSDVKSIKAILDGSDVVCANNTIAGTSYMTIPTTAGTYTITPFSANCSGICPTLNNVATYNSFPTCGAATCNSGYKISGSGASATCVVSGGGGVPFHILQKINEVIQEDTTEEESSVEEIKDSYEKKIDIITEILSEAAEIVKADINGLLGRFGFKRNLAKEQVAVKKYVKSLIKNAQGLSKNNEYALTNFITYGTATTLGLGEGERAGVVNSYKSAFGKLPTTDNEWSDAIKIANGRWPSKINAETEANAEAAFEKIYLRKADRSNPNDDAAVVVIAYGLRPANRNLNSEKAAIKIFKAIYSYNPESATAWDIVRAIAYSGAMR